MPAKKTRAKKAQAKKKPARKTQAKKAQAKKKPARKTQAKEILSPDTPPADGRSPFTQLPLEIHMVIGDMLKEDKRLDALPTLARTSRRLCSFYEQQLYKGKDNTHRVKALMWGVAHDSVTVMKSARQWGADLNVRSYHLDRKRSRRNNYISGKGTALQFAIRDGHNESMCWLLDERARVDIPGKPAWGMCQCGSYSRSYASSLHLAFCNGNLLAATILLRRAPEASVQYSRKVDTGSILKTAVKAAFGRYSVRFLDVALENPAIRKSINAFQEEDLHTPLALALSPEYEGDDLLEPILAALVKAGASLGPYPQGSHMEGHSPLLLLLDRGDRESATYLLRLGCDPNGDRPHPVTPAWQSPLHFYINPESHNRWSTPAWHQQVFHRWRLTPREFIVVLLEHGASLDITNAEGVSPLDNAISFMARYVAPRRRVAGFKLVKLLLANVKPEGISTKSRERAEGVMTTLVQDLRAEHATHNLSDVRVRPPLEEWEMDEEESHPILLGWHVWRREGGRLRRK